MITGVQVVDRRTLPATDVGEVPWYRLENREVSPDETHW